MRKTTLIGLHTGEETKNLNLHRYGNFLKLYTRSVEREVKGAFNNT
jgi:hypothetical protein